MKLILCDDDPQFLDYMRRFLIQHFDSDIKVYTYTNYSNLQSELEEGCDLLFMDIQLSEGNGISFSSNISKQYPQLPIIFVSGYADSYYQQAFLNIRPYGFLRKPIDEQLLLQLIQKFQLERQTLQPAYYYFKTLDGIEKILFDDIYFLENNHHLVYIYTDKETIPIRTTFSNILSILPSDLFIQCHRGYIVNFKHIEKYQGGYFIMDDDAHTVITISKLKTAEIRKRFLEFLKTAPNRY